MLGSLATKLFGSRNDRIIKQLSKNVQKINALEPEMEALDDEALRAKTDEFKARLGKESLDDLLVEAFAVVREAAKRVLGMRHYDVQLIGGMVLHMGKIAEMRTGEGKTLVATLAVYLNALSGHGVHVITVNDYLARRDGEELGRLYAFLGMSTGIIVSGMSPAEKQAAYRADITYGTNNEFGFDYLRTNMAISPEDRLQRELNYAIIDEVDSILIDEARTPLIISGAADMNTDLYRILNDLVPQLSPQVEEDGPGDFSIDEKSKQAGLTESGHEHVEELLRENGLLAEGESLYDPKNIGIFHHLNACLRAHYLFHNNVDYIVRNDEVIIVDEFTGRTMEGRRWSDGLHQAIEIKEGVSIKQETQTLASITYQNFFRMYDKLAGMTGTADTEAFEFQDIYGLETVVIPTNKPIARIDHTDLIFLKQAGKYHAIVDDVMDCQQRGQPVLLGTASIETSELVSDLLTKAGVKHDVLNAKQHAREAEIVANAGLPGQVTIATNMAGRGTDIVLGGNLKAELAALGEEATEAEKEKIREDWQKRHDTVIAAGGLHVIGAERHESRRIDNQLRGRSGRQGDPGSSRFYVALDDNLVRIFAGDKMANLMQRFGMNEEEAIESKMVSRQIEGAQRKVEAHNFDARKNLLEYDDVANEQRKVIYHQRSQIMDAETISEMINEMRETVINRLVEEYLPENQVRQNWDVRGLEAALLGDFNIKVDIDGEWFEQDPNLSQATIRERLTDLLMQIDRHKREQFGDEVMNWGEKFIALQTIDDQWKGHLTTMDMLRQAIWMRSRAQKDPKREYQREAFELFSDLLDAIQFQVVRIMAQINFQQPEVAMEETQSLQEQAEENRQQELASADYQGSDEDGEAVSLEEYANVGRNDLCPCGSGKKFKHCHGKLA
ncbi:preprotein translocase subunit SecA [Suttonella ornithocola]|uniref:Protein translocase subunit SecA n=1 Tax=Suttonella ornithocola TaxID=279832 RepID=A0A380MNK8_9GAMM|nr:preprotein translocase subunit SecA [Suttonella ornithocola]SUO93311.1 preprotein translocase subunit SecA [Suttonella ornithocola]